MADELRIPGISHSLAYALIGIAYLGYLINFRQFYSEGSKTQGKLIRYNDKGLQI